MAVVVALLRGVNVGGKKVGMADLKAQLEKDGFAPVKTWLQSGNVVFEAGQLSDAKAAEAVQKAVNDSAGVDCHVLVRSAAELKAALAADPFPGCDGSKATYTFLDGPPAEGGVAALRDRIKGPEEIAAGDGVIYGAFRESISASELFKVDWRKVLKTEVTARNRNTVRKLVEIAEAMAG